MERSTENVQPESQEGPVVDDNKVNYWLLANSPIEESKPAASSGRLINNKIEELK